MVKEEEEVDKIWFCFIEILLGIKWPTRPQYHKAYWMLSCAFGSVYFLLSIFMIFSLTLTWRKYKQITRRNTFEAWDQTYCLFSKILVLVVLLATPVYVCLLIYVAILFV